MLNYDKQRCLSWKLPQKAYNKSIEKRMFTSINIFNSSCEPKKIVEKIKSAIESSYEDGSIQQKM